MSSRKVALPTEICRRCRPITHKNRHSRLSYGNLISVQLPKAYRETVTLNLNACGPGCGTVFSHDSLQSSGPEDRTLSCMSRTTFQLTSYY
jgi:hypothetical protein